MYFISSGTPIVLVPGASAAVGLLLEQFRGNGIGFALMIQVFAARRRWIAVAQEATLANGEYLVWP